MTELIQRHLNEQWIEVIDGKMHMLKAVKHHPYSACGGCFFHDLNYEKGDYDPDDIKCLRSECVSDGKMITGHYVIAKDLGVIDNNGLLPCPFCGEYPVVENAYEGCGHTPPDGYWRVYCSNDNHEISMSSGKRRQESIDAWNRRA